MASLTADLLTKITGFIRRYVVMSEDEALAVALWVLHTHTFAAADASPTLSVNSAEKRSGKTLLLEVLSLIVARPWLTAKVTAALLVRKVALTPPPTLLLDEADAAFNGPKEHSEALRGILNAGYRRGGVTSVLVPTKGGNWQPMDFPVFSPRRSLESESCPTPWLTGQSPSSSGAERPGRPESVFADAMFSSSASH